MLKHILFIVTATLLLSSPCIAEDNKPAPKETDYSYITAESIVAISLYPNRVLTNPDNKLYPVEVISAAGLQSLGIDPIDVESVLVIAEPPAPMPGVGIIVKTVKPYAIEKLLPSLKNQLVDAELDGKAYLKATMPMGFSIYKQDENTLIFSTEPFLEKILNTHKEPVESALKKKIPEDALQSDLLITLYLDPVKPMLAGPVAMIPVPPEFDELKSIPDLISFIQIRFSLNSNFHTKLSLFSPNEENTTILEETLVNAISTVKEKFLSEMPANNRDPVAKASAAYMKRLANYYVEAVKPKKNGNELYLEGEGSAVSNMGTTGVLVALLLPAVQQAREAARRTQARNTLKQIALAMHNYHDVYQNLPARANFDKDGKPLLSWRVHILPFLEQNELYKQFKLDEPWDSEHNKKLISKMPAIYQNPNIAVNNFKTNYLVPVGKGTAFEGKEGIQFRQISDGTVNSILAVEADEDQSVTWSKPEDLKYDPADPYAGLGNFRPGMIQALFADGSVRAISISVDEEILQALFSIAGREIIPNF